MDACMFDTIVRRARKADPNPTKQRAVWNFDLLMLLFRQQEALKQAKLHRTRETQEENYRLRARAGDCERTAAMIPVRTSEDLKNKARMLLESVNYVIREEDDTNGHRMLVRSLCQEIIGDKV